MQLRQVPTTRTARRAVASAAIVGLALTATACNRGSTSDSGSGGGDAAVGVTLITKDSTNPFFVAMQKGAKADATKNNVKLTVASGKQEGDDQGQITAIEDAVARGDKGILITPMSTGVNAAIKKARDAGLYVIALDTPPDPADTVDITFATDNRSAGKLDGQWAAATLDGKPAVIALLDLFDDKIVSVDYNRDQGFLEGMGIDVADPKKNGDEAKTGTYSGGKGGQYTIVCNEAGNGAEDGGRSAMEKCLAKNPDINLVYTINEPTAVGANAALKAAGKTATIVSVDGGCAGVSSVKSGVIGATAQQYPLKMATLGMEAIAKIARGGEKPKTTEGLDFFDTGVALVTDKPVDGVESIDSAKGADLCWGN
ncbi:MAG: substrate-binding domain-containing protein [Micrococcales bacterium]|uniref:substrate-binding domain-containing protein n=1 Tax=Phycicoccus sp. TaxID=1902410 RepID=UPI001989C59A|nr:substrate-binding domain-containing protein [Phycicoccus sp.]MBD3782393.1 substrate-binding domain-containing protein [Micrococcales bacterium]HMM95208.1 substrate-binding domain-containing protein [Phycicoccus sp.]